MSSLVARNTLGRSNAALEQSLTRLSTGLRINTGKDDPAGLIASENLRSDITSIRKAISNTERANQVIATADSALGQVSSLLNDIRGLVTESANNGALSEAQIAANQLQIDSSLEALNRIAQTTTFQGRKLLDGSLDFITSTSDTDFVNVQSLQIDQANLGASGTVPVSLTVTTAATQGQIDVAGIPSGSTPAQAATGNLAITVQTAAAQAAIGTAVLTNGSIDITAAVAGLAGNNAGLVIDIVDGASVGASFDGVNTITVTVDITNDPTNSTVADIAGLINGLTDFSAAVNTGGGGAGVAETCFAAPPGGGAAYLRRAVFAPVA
ncbi:MAG TPA: flagellin, partial [Lacipirellulaceae bacterium]|nr:flagellin [Lacipirellulaceae bacterium]